jgi:hypothetical protein
MFLRLSALSRRCGATLPYSPHSQTNLAFAGLITQKREPVKANRGKYSIKRAMLFGIASHL